MSAVLGWGALVALTATWLEAWRRARLLAAAEHELRGPLTAFELCLERLRREGRAGDAGEAMSAEVARARLALADMAAARSGRRARRRRSSVRVAELVRASAQAWGAAAPVRLDWRAGDVVAHADRGGVASALGNLVQNAAEHGSGPIELSAWRAPGRVVVEVANDSRHPLRGGSAPVAGRGLGLAIARRAARDAGGEVTIVPVEHGARVALELPVHET